MVRCFTLRPDYMSDYRLWQPAPLCSACRSSALVFCFAMPLPSTPLLISIIEQKSESLRQFLLCRHAFMVEFIRKITKKPLFTMYKYKFFNENVGCFTKNI